MKKGILLSIILEIISFILPIVGIYGFYSGVNILLYISGAFLTLEYIRGFMTGQLTSLYFPILVSLTTIVIVKDFWKGLFLGVCIEVLLATVLAIFIYIFMFVIGMKEEKKNEE